MRSISGFTIIEVLAVLLVITAMLSAIIPSLKNFFILQGSKHMLSTIELHVHSSREQAVQLQVPVTMCPSLNKIECHSDWNKPIIIFTDKNRNNRVDHDDRVLGEIRASKDDELRHFTGRVIQFHANGFANINTGSLSYCSDTTELVTGVLIISRVGRIRRGITSNRDGRKKLANGQDIPCK